MNIIANISWYLGIVLLICGIAKLTFHIALTPVFDPYWLSDIYAGLIILIMGILLTILGKIGRKDK